MRLSEEQLVHLRDKRSKHPEHGFDLKKLFPEDAWIPRQTPHFKALNYLFKHPGDFSARQEHFEQCFIFHYMEIHHPRVYEMMYAVPNSGRRAKMERGMMSSQGLKKGVPDIILDLPCAGFHGLRIELKRTGGKRSSVSKEQEIWLSKMALNGYKAEVCFGWKEAIDCLLSYIGEPLETQVAL